VALWDSFAMSGCCYFLELLLESAAAVDAVASSIDCLRISFFVLYRSANAMSVVGIGNKFWVS